MSAKTGTTDVAVSVPGTDTDGGKLQVMFTKGQTKSVTAGLPKAYRKHAVLSAVGIFSYVGAKQVGLAKSATVTLTNKKFKNGDLVFIYSSRRHGFVPLSGAKVSHGKITVKLPAGAVIAVVAP